jgi:drug/metabolite transporter (DMT)-like permease
MASLSSTPPSMKWQDWFLLLFLSLLWGSSFFFVEIIIREIPTITLVSIRLILSALILYGILFITGKRLPINKPLIQTFFIMGLLNSVLPYSLIAWGQHYVSSGMAATLIASTPILTVVAAHYFTHDEKTTTQKLLGVFVGFIGVVVMLSDQFDDSNQYLMIGKVAMLLASACYACGAIYSKKASKHGLSPLQTATGQMTAAAILLTPFSIVIDKPWQLSTLNQDTVLSITGLVLLSSVLAYVLFFNLMKSAGVTNLILVAFLIPMSSIILGVLFLNEILTMVHILGMLLIGISLTIIDGNLPKYLQQKLQAN